MGSATRKRGGLLAVGLILVLSAGCSSGSGSRATTTTTSTATGGSTTTTTPATTAVALYFVRGPYLGVAHRHLRSEPSIGSETLSALLGGPLSSETAAGLSTAVPPGTILRSLSVDNGIATADVSSAFSRPASPGDELARVAEVVYTLTQFPTVSKVAFKVEGRTPTPFASGAVDLSHAIGRSDVLGALPAILVEEPAVGDSLGSTLHLRGVANVFEAQFNVQVLDGSGHSVLSSPVHASAGSGTWGSFDVSLPMPGGLRGTLTVRIYDVSAKDGSAIDEVDLHLPVDLHVPGQP